MDTQQPVPSFDESVAQVMQTLPPVIRDYLTQGKYTLVAKSLMTKYGLRIDQAGILEREIMLLLMGIENPDEFVKSLAEEAKLDQQTINSITRDVNDQIFVPLREEMRKGGGQQQTAPASTAAPQAPRPTMLPPLRSTVIPTNPQVSPVTALPKKGPQPPQTFAPGQRYTPPAKYFHLQNKIPPAPPAPPQPKLDSRKLLEDHEEPHIEFKKAPHVTETPLRQALRAVLPHPFEASGVVGPPANLPGAMPPIPTPEVQPSPVIPKVEPQTQPRVAPAPAKPYSSDPYREPIEP